MGRHHKCVPHWRVHRGDIFSYRHCHILTQPIQQISSNQDAENILRRYTGNDDERVGEVFEIYAHNCTPEPRRHDVFFATDAEFDQLLTHCYRRDDYHIQINLNGGPFESDFSIDGKEEDDAITDMFKEIDPRTTDALIEQAVNNGGFAHV